jgi:hypothetical protein
MDIANSTHGERLGVQNRQISYAGIFFLLSLHTFRLISSIQDKVVVE